MRDKESMITVTSHEGGDWKIAIVGGAMVAIGVGIALLAAQLGTAMIILSVGASLGVAAAGVGKALEYRGRGKGAEHLGQALIMAARRGQLPEAAEGARLMREARLLQDGQRKEGR